MFIAHAKPKGSFDTCPLKELSAVHEVTGRVQRVTARGSGQCWGEGWRKCIWTVIFLFRFPLSAPIVDRTTERRHIWEVYNIYIASPPPTFITTLDTVVRSLPTLMVLSIDFEKHFLIWTKLLVKLRKKVVQNWNCDSSFKVLRGIRCWYTCSVTLTTTCPGHWWSSSHLITYFSDCFKPPTMVGVNILSDLLEGWCQSLDLRHCLNYVFRFLLKARCEAPEIR